MIEISFVYIDTVFALKLKKKNSYSYTIRLFNWNFYSKHAKRKKKKKSANKIKERREKKEKKEKKSVTQCRHGKYYNITYTTVADFCGTSK